MTPRKLSPGLLKVHKLVYEDIDVINQLGEERTIKLNSKYEDMNLRPQKSYPGVSVQQWDGENFLNPRCRKISRNR
ncbi:hypothetical protein GALMADRAFT_253181 [Galerina marginata CBS 339.88]|uniref:Uncharacterized protein n=1 Tax=Galerina marginata (strain CBS 339.88) TaxID=685588 RepID=A0A067SXE3_GALM3|nr:hypothetical protein GALMADRAFT_253181 [Galerina marginata CBS 339.88]